MRAHQGSVKWGTGATGDPEVPRGGVGAPPCPQAPRCLHGRGTAGWARNEPQHRHLPLSEEAPKLREIIGLGVTVPLPGRNFIIYTVHFPPGVGGRCERGVRGGAGGGGKGWGGGRKQGDKYIIRTRLVLMRAPLSNHRYRHHTLLPGAD